MTRPFRTAGFTLIELMVAMVVGLIVIGATLALAVSLMRTNNETIRTTRLTQELRGVADIISAEVRRARSLSDPLANVGVGAAALANCSTIYPALANGTQTCLRFGYGCNPNDGTGTFKAIRQSGANLMIGTGTAAIACDAATTQLNSPELVIDSANFASTAQGAVNISVTGHLSSDASISRTVTRTVWPRSVPVAP